MDKLENKKALLYHISEVEGDRFFYEEDAILMEYKKQDQNKSSLAIKILTIFGGFSAMLAFLGFLLISGLYDSEIGMLIFGIIFIVSALILDKIFNKLIIDTFCVSLFIIGLVLLCIGLFEMRLNENTVALIICAISFSSLFLTQNYILSFLAILIFNGSLLSLILINDYYNLIHLYIAINTVLVTFVFLNEAKIIASHKYLSKIYNPIRIGSVFALLFGLIAIGKSYLIPISPNQLWISSIIMILAIIYIVYSVIEIINVTAFKTKLLIYTLSALIMLLTLFSPATSGAIVIVLLSFLVNYKTGFVIGIISFIYFISQYYYDLTFTLLIKSIILMASGVVFLLFYILITKKLSSHEKV
ncbi:DUF4401 domain-containing protein [Bizionia argentinensis JUB59]|uniref:DUF4401 domain-containing protein n=1 Tax=Bizionia argentinensis JUB59 TaxID=1046627 RepID=G2EH07_9FLAO|nr:DUF4401 domain-containing protein [Bizionia argentinensis]EGV42120.1 DUF4401 domain-containing protein [Bizionia argentinensis JUB59]